MPSQTNEILVVDADLLAIREFGPFLHRVVPPAVEGDPSDVIGGMELAVQELAVNIVEHAYGDAGGSLSISWTVDAGSGVIEVRDQGPPFDWKAAQRADLGVPQVNGYGLIIIETIAESFTHTREGDENVWVMRFDLTA